MRSTINCHLTLSSGLYLSVLLAMKFKITIFVLSSVVQDVLALHHARDDAQGHLGPRPPAQNFNHIYRVTRKKY